jgi:inner membrane protein
LILLQVSDLRGALSDAELTLEDGTKHAFSPESLNRGYGSGQYISASIPNLADNGSLKVSATLRLGGAKQISIIPFAKSTKIKIAGNWPHPGFSGDYLPDNKQISDNGFVGSRTIPKLASGLPDTLSINAWNKFSQQDKGMNVSFVSLSSPYQFVSRSLKYAPLFIGLVFLTFFLFEMSNKRPVHAAQYVLVGLAQTVFYLLLLAFSEHIGFDLAFAIAAIAVVGMTGLYAGAVFGKKQTVTALLLFSGVYLLLFVLMRLVDYALIVGALASLIGIATTMYMTRNLQWYGSGNDK